MSETEETPQEAPEESPLQPGGRLPRSQEVFWSLLSTLAKGYNALQSIILEERARSEALEQRLTALENNVSTILTFLSYNNPHAGLKPETTDADTKEQTEALRENSWREPEPGEV